jgi:predicted dehydrogenase
VADSPVRWGILGTGGIASAFVTDLRLTDSGVAVAVGSRRQGSADRFADEFGIANRHGRWYVESPLMPLDETISIMETMDTVLARARQNA